MNGCETPYRHNDRKWLCRHFEAVATPIFVGSTAITRVVHRRRSRLCISRPQYETFTLPKQCRTKTHTQKLTISLPHRLCLLGKFSDVAGANRLEADLPEVNLPQRKKERSARMAGRHLPVAPTFAEGLTALHGIEAVREWRSTNRALSGLPTKCGSTETAP